MPITCVTGSGARRDGICRWSANAPASTSGPPPSTTPPGGCRISTGIATYFSVLPAPCSSAPNPRSPCVPWVNACWKPRRTPNSPPADSSSPSRAHASDGRWSSVCRLLLELGVLMRVAGDEEGYVNQSGDVLYDVHRRVLARLPAGTRGASLIAMTQSDLDFDDRLAALVDEYVPDSPEGRRTGTAASTGETAARRSRALSR